MLCTECQWTHDHVHADSPEEAGRLLNPKADAPQIYRIPATNIETLRERFDKLTKKAAKLGVPAPTFTVVNTVTEYECRDLHAIALPAFYDNSAPPFFWSPLDLPHVQARTGRQRTVYEITVSGEAPKFAGWSLLGTIENDPAFPDLDSLVHVVSGTVDPRWYHVHDYCDHCFAAGRYKPRGRKQLVIVRHDNGETKIVGKTCLRDFLGHTSPERIASWCSYVDEFFAECDDAENDEYRGARDEQRLEAADFLAQVTKIIRTVGWTPKSAATAQRPATVELATADFFWRSTSYDKDAPETPSPQDYETGREAIEWAQTVEADNDYLRNLRIVAQKNVWRYNELGIGASVVAAYRRAQEQEINRALRAKQNESSEYVGNVGDRIEISGTVTFTRGFPGDYGTRTLVKICSEEGNLFTWWASSWAPKQGDKVTGKATIKKHEEFKGVRSTVIQRFKWERIEETS